MPEPVHPIIRHLPNTLTVLRLIAVPVFLVMFLVEGGTSLATGLVFMAAAFTDFFDGLIARKYGVMSQFGKVADPIADRLLVNSAAMLLCFYDSRVYGWEFLIVVARDIGAMYGMYRLRGHVLVPDVHWIGKLGMALMMAGMAWLLVLPQATWPIYPFRIGLALSLIAMTMYIVRYRWVLRVANGAQPHAMAAARSGVVDLTQRGTADPDGIPTGEVEGSVYSRTDAEAEVDGDRANGGQAGHSSGSLPGTTEGT